MANFCSRCGIPLAIGDETDFCSEHSGPPLAPDATVRCPFCSETIFASAKKCKHCGEFLGAELPQSRHGSLVPSQPVSSAGTMKFKNPSNGQIEYADKAWLWALLFGAFYFASKEIWSHTFIGFVLAIPTFGLSWLIYPCFATEIVRTNYLRKGWIEIS
jgi:hypothetical protein